MTKSLIVFLLLGIVVVLCQSAIDSKQAGSERNPNFRRCQKARNGQFECFCGINQVKFDRSKGERCVNGKVVRLR